MIIDETPAIPPESGFIPGVLKRMCGAVPPIPPGPPEYFCTPPVYARHLPTLYIYILSLNILVLRV